MTFLVCQGKNSKKRISTEISVADSELSSNGKKIKNVEKAMLVERMRRKLEDRLAALSLDLAGRKADASYIVERITVAYDEVEFFAFSDEWLEHTDIKGKKNYVTMLNTLEGTLDNASFHSHLLLTAHLRGSKNT